MVQNIIILSLVITGIYVAFQQGMLFGWLRIMVANWLDKLVGKKVSKYIQKPLWDCLPCMSGLWYIVLIHSFNLVTILAICGLNSLIDKLLDYETSFGG
jgi:hypothetical protein